MTQEGSLLPGGKACCSHPIQEATEMPNLAGSGKGKPPPFELVLNLQVSAPAGGEEEGQPFKEIKGKAGGQPCPDTPNRQ